MKCLEEIIRVNAAGTPMGQFIELDAQLRILCDTGLGDSEEADAMRDRMDEFYYALDERELRILRDWQ